MKLIARMRALAALCSSPSLCQRYGSVLDAMHKSSMCHAFVMLDLHPLIGGYVCRLASVLRTA